MKQKTKKKIEKVFLTDYSHIMDKQTKPQDWEIIFDNVLIKERFYEDKSVIEWGNIKDFIRTLLTDQRKQIKAELLDDCNRNENEEGRLLVERYFYEK